MFFKASKDLGPLHMYTALSMLLASPHNRIIPMESCAKITPQPIKKHSICSTLLCVEMYCPKCMEVSICSSCHGPHIQEIKPAQVQTSSERLCLDTARHSPHMPQGYGTLFYVRSPPPNLLSALVSWPYCRNFFMDSACM